MGDDFPCDRSALPLVVTVTNLNIGKSNHRKCSTERLDEGIENFEDLTHFIGDEWNCVWKNVEEIPEFDDFLQLALGHSSSRPSSLFQSEVDATYSGHIANEPAAEPKTVFVERTNFVPVSYPGKDGNGKEQDSLEWISHIPELAALFGTATRTIKVNHTEHKGSKNGDTTNVSIWNLYICPLLVLNF